MNIGNKINDITMWSHGDERAPHKPLLLLYALSVLFRESRRWIPYIEIDEKLKTLLIEFGPFRKSHHPEYPFWRLQNDGIWELKNACNVMCRQSNTDAKKSELIKYNVEGAFTSEVYNQLKADKKLIISLMEQILNRNFPESIHSDILQAIGLGSDLSSFSVVNIQRDATFRDRILKAYEYKCAICGFDVRIHNQTIGLEAAHIKWHQAGGPDGEDNGLALCSIHHKLFDYGAFSLTSNKSTITLLVSDCAHGTKGFDEWLMAFHKKKIKQPQHPDYIPRNEFVEWHIREVFKGYSRY